MTAENNLRRPPPNPIARRSFRLLFGGLALAVALSLGASVGPARSRDRGTRSSRNAAARSASGSQRWDTCLDGCELALHAAGVELHAPGMRATPCASGLDGGDAPLSFGTAASALRIDLEPVATAPVTPVHRVRDALPRFARGRAPPVLV